MTLLANKAMSFFLSKYHLCRSQEKNVKLILTQTDVAHFLSLAHGHMISQNHKVGGRRFSVRHCNQNINGEQASMQCKACPPNYGYQFYQSLNSELF